MTTRILAVFLLALVALTTTPAAQVFRLDGYAPREGRFLVAGQPVRVDINVFVPARVRAIYRPGSVLEETDELPLDPGGASLRFTPREAGLVLLQAYATATGDDGAETETSLGQQVVSVRFAAGSASGLVVMILAALVLFGGAFCSIRALRREGTRGAADVTT